MKFITDTNAFIWFVTDAPQLSATAKRHIESSGNERFLSIASVWEIAIKASIGKLSFDQPFEKFLPEQIALNQFVLLNVSLAHVLQVNKLPLHHRDPFDRMLIAQGMVEGIPILSSDQALDHYGVQRLWL